MNHIESHPLAGKTVRVVLKAPLPQLQGLEHDAWIEDWWDKLTGKSWMFSDGNPSCLFYALRTGLDPTQSIPTDDEVLYVKIDRLGYLIHISELAGEEDQ